MGGSPRDFLDERFHSKVMSLGNDTLHFPSKPPEAQVFQFFLGWKTDGNWLLVEKMRREIDMYGPMRGTRHSVFNRGFSRWSKGRASDISRTRGNRFHFQWNESSCFPGKCLFSTNSRSRWRGTLCWAEMRCNFLR